MYFIASAWGTGSPARAAYVLADHESAGVVRFDFSGRNSIHTNEAEPAQHAFRAEVFGKKLFVAETVLKCGQHRLLVQKWRDEIEKVSIRRRLYGDDDQIALPDFLRRVVTVHVRNSEVPAFSTNVETVALDFTQIAAHQKMHVGPAMGQVRAIIAANCSGTDDGDSHFFFTRAVAFPIGSCA